MKHDVFGRFYNERSQCEPLTDDALNTNTTSGLLSIIMLMVIASVFSMYSFTTRKVFHDNTIGSMCDNCCLFSFVQIFLSKNYGANNYIYRRNDVTAHSSVANNGNTLLEVDDDGVGKRKYKIFDDTYRHDNDDMYDDFHSNKVNGELTNTNNNFVQQHGYLVNDEDKYDGHTMFQPHIGLCSEPPFIFG